jgi:hypothetical protein
MALYAICLPSVIPRRICRPRRFGFYSFRHLQDLRARPCHRSLEPTPVWSSSSSRPETARERSAGPWSLAPEIRPSYADNAPHLSVFVLSLTSCRAEGHDPSV